ncbi:hypothetical protein [Tenacibaculum agarivorans]|uniref:hypothetical protein n=1 Tax=Tenacibaculum agarivorans TaxID=1908389 RepID=UPI000AB6883C|nr:hypothetical protein [Tenacibaculum agarivorans]
MKTYKILTLFAVGCLLSLQSCDQEDTSFTSDTNAKVVVMELSKTKSFEGNSLGIYSNEFKGLQDFTLRNKITKYGMSNTPENYLSSYGITKDLTDLNAINKASFGTIRLEKDHKIMAPVILPSLSNKTGVASKQQVQQAITQIIHDNYGKERDFTIETNQYQIHEKMYVPKQINIQQIGNYNSSLQTYESQKNNLSVQYNIDENNKNGVALLVLWDGSRRDMNTEELASLNMGYQSKTIIFDPIDSGHIDVPAHALSKFPNQANLTLVLMRGNGKIIEKNNTTNYIITSSEHYQRMVLLD